MNENEKEYYMDCAATTPLSSKALEAMMPYLTKYYGNASTIYAPGQRARKALEESRKKIASCIGAEASELYFTSGGSESDNWALLKGAEAGRRRLRKKAEKEGQPEDADKIRGHVITDKIEHHAVLRTCEYLEANGFDVTYLNTDEKGFISPDDVLNAIRPDTVLVSIMTANNEIGTIEPISRIGKLLKEHEHQTGQKILFHSDAVQAFGHIPISTDEMGVDLLSASAHKLNGPKGIGFLYMRKGTKLPGLILGGEQERGRRAGTENVAGAVGFARAAEISCAEMKERNKEETKVRDHLIHRILREIPDTSLNGDPITRLPNNINVCFRGIEGEPLLLLLGQKHIYASSGSACASGSMDPSHVLLAIGKSHEDAYGALRLTIGPDTTIEDADYVAETLKVLVDYLRKENQ